MVKKDVEDYLQEGIYGAKELKPDEKRKYLGTYRERVLLALSKAQVRGEKGLTELESLMRQYSDASLLMNGNMSLRFFKPYREIADKHHITHTYVSNRETDSEYGLIFVAKTAVDKQDILLVEEEKVAEKPEAKSWWKKLFGL
ncbi:YueI family protein [Gracilibacillus sp. S3-1-1]|uniref:YueI family protein n=1 Tax=Gracilibacillus pellucidus TaxID=3095368 RepID=A0ACC6M5X7_9BACI|nr:YueI family protein [Gracilibacillus sp. S3-1-1]MDX8046374.1 YueI family protein [Gracilibacillus sp. S3-1-1]